MFTARIKFVTPAICSTDRFLNKRRFQTEALNFQGSNKLGSAETLSFAIKGVPYIAHLYYFDVEWTRDCEEVVSTM